jgi:hypothetical protein
VEGSQWTTERLDGARRVLGSGSCLKMEGVMRGKEYDALSFHCYTCSLTDIADSGETFMVPDGVDRRER